MELTNIQQVIVNGQMEGLYGLLLLIAIISVAIVAVYGIMGIFIFCLNVTEFIFNYNQKVATVFIDTILEDNNLNKNDFYWTLIKQ